MQHYTTLYNVIQNYTVLYIRLCDTIQRYTSYTTRTIQCYTKLYKTI